MAEEYIGPQFKTVFLRRSSVTEPNIKKLIFWGRKLSLLGLTPAYEFAAAGNLSFRTDFGFVITAAGKDLGSLTEDDFIEVMACDLEKREVTVVGKKEPSSETMLHYAVYQKRPEIKVIFHVHDDYAINNCEALGLKCTEKEQPASSVELIEEVMKVLDALDYLVLRKHGILSLGMAFDEVGERIIEVNSRMKG
jgi:ribulose-5-phosphate 4-epimerase/fuculose-1-phosphate aldolase